MVHGDDKMGTWRRKGGVAWVHGDDTTLKRGYGGDEVVIIE